MPPYRLKAAIDNSFNTIYVSYRSYEICGTFENYINSVSWTLDGMKYGI